MKKATLIVGLSGMLVSTLALTAVVSAQEEAPLEKVAKLTLAVGEEVQMRPSLMKYWKVPGDTDKMFGKLIKIYNQAGDVKWFLVVRQRPKSSKIDMIIFENFSDGISSNYWLTSQSGDLEKTCYKKQGNESGPINEKEARVKFQQIIKDLQEWERNYKPEGRPA